MISPDNCNTYGNPVNEDDITITIVRAAYPREMIKELKEIGYTINEDIKNIYHINGAQFPIQIVVTKSLSDSETSIDDGKSRYTNDYGNEENDMIWLNALSANISKNTYNIFLENINQLDVKHTMFAEAILDIVSDVNEKKIETWKEEHSMMNDAMKRIMAKELKESKDEGIAEGHSAGLAEGHSAGLAEGRSAGLAEGRSAGLAEGRSAGLAEGQDRLAEAMITAQKENISDASRLEELGFDKRTSISTINVLRKLGIIS